MPITFRRALSLLILSLSLITVALGQSISTETKDFAAFQQVLGESAKEQPV